jgi:hypothetical protein
MTNRSSILAIGLAIAFAPACASSGHRNPTPSASMRYACGDTTVTRTGAKLTVDVRTAAASNADVATDILGPAQLGWSDDDGDHFVTWPHATTDVEAVEYVVPHDTRKDAVAKRYDASGGYASSDWRLLDKRVCRAEGGYNDVLARWMNGESLDKLARELELGDRSNARAIVRTALRQLEKAYYRDR